MNKARKKLPFRRRLRDFSLFRAGVLSSDKSVVNSCKGLLQYIENKHIKQICEICNFYDKQMSSL